MIAIFDYGAGNLQSVQNTLGELGCDYTLVRDSAGLRQATKIMLPGVGHFGQMMRALDATRCPRPPSSNASAPACRSSESASACRRCSNPAKKRPKSAAWASIPALSDASPPACRVPHMGWNELEARPDSQLLRGIAPSSFVYFAHSYYVPVVPQTAAICTYELPYTAVLEAGNVFGVQFHPEKSGAVGLRIVRNFL